MGGTGWGGGVSRAAPQWQPAPALPFALDPAGAQAVDAYLLWDLWSGFGRQAWRQLDAQALPMVPILVELAVPAAQAAGRLAGLSGGPAVAAGGAALAAGLGPSLARWPGSAFHTALVQRDLVLPALAASTAQGVLVRWQLGAACAEPRAMPVSPAPAALAGAGGGPILGIVDDGCCLAHAHYRSPAGASRFAWVWDQEPAVVAPAPWLRARPPGSDAEAEDAEAHQALVQHGAELHRVQIEALLNQHPGLGELAERGLYTALARPHWGTAGHTHGARVTHLMAGRAAPGQENGGAADTADIVFVQLPHSSLTDTSGQSIPMQVLDGARYIVARAGMGGRSARAEADTATICLSLGGTAGPHDGSTMVEQALDELAALPGVSVVVAAGNLPASRSADPARWLHAQRSVRNDQPGRFLLHVSAANRRHAFVELWIPDNGQEVGPEQFTVSVAAPGLAPSEAVGPGQAVLLRRPAEGPAAAPGPMAALVAPRRVAQGSNGGLVLLAIAATAGPAGEAPGPATAPAGLWVLTVQSSAATAVTVHAWVERDDGFVPPRRPQQTWFERDPDDAPSRPSVNDDCTLSSLANGRKVLVAGGYVQASGHAVDGPQRARRRGLANKTAAVDQYLAPTDRGRSRTGLQVPGFFSGQTASLRGSSAAAPQVARWVARGRPGDAQKKPDLSDREPGEPDASPAPVPDPVGPVRRVPARGRRPA